MTQALFPNALRGRVIDDVDTYDLLPVAIRRMHDVEEKLIASGKADIALGQSAFAKIVARLFRFPKAGNNISVTTTFTRSAEGETLSRDFAGHLLTTEFYAWPEAGMLLERFGPFWFLIDCQCSSEGIDMHIKRFWLWKHIPFPLFLSPRIVATERVHQGKYQFDVDVALPIIGRIIHYKGWLV